MVSGKLWLVLIALLAISGCSEDVAPPAMVTVEVAELQEASKDLPPGGTALKILRDGWGWDSWLLWNYRNRCYLSPRDGKGIKGIAVAPCPH